MAVISDSVALDSSLHNNSIGNASALPVSSSVTNSTTLRLALPKKQGQEVCTCSAHFTLIIHLHVCVYMYMYNLYVHLFITG